MKFSIKTVFLIAAILAVAVIFTPTLRERLKALFVPTQTPCGAPTQGPVTATTVPGITLTAGGQPWTGSADIPALSKGYPITLNNATTAPITIDFVRLWQSVDLKFVPEEELRPECRNMAISGGDCAPGSLPVTLAPNATGTILISVGRPQAGYLDINTSIGQLTLPLYCRP